MPSRTVIKLRDVSNELSGIPPKQDVNKNKAHALYKADPEKKASVRDSYKADPEKKKASYRLAKCASERRGTAGVTELPPPPKGMLWHVVLTLKSCACNICRA